MRASASAVPRHAARATFMLTPLLASPLRRQKTPLESTAQVLPSLHSHCRAVPRPGAQTVRVDEHAFATQNDFVDVEKLLLSASGHTTPAAIWPGYGGGYLVFSGNKSITVG